MTVKDVHGLVRNISKLPTIFLQFADVYSLCPILWLGLTKHADFETSLNHHVRFTRIIPVSYIYNFLITY